MDAVMHPLEVTAVIVTRGDCDLTEIRESLIFPHVIVWNNAQRYDVGAFGRYLAAAEAPTDVIYFQDDDCIVSPEDQMRLVESHEPGILSALMPAERVDYKDTVLIGWGALFERDLAYAAFARWQIAGHPIDTREFMVVGCDFVFPMLSPWKRLDSHHRDLPHAHAENRTWASFPDYANVKAKFLTDARAVRG